MYVIAVIPGCVSPAEEQISSEPELPSEEVVHEEPQVPETPVQPDSQEPADQPEPEVPEVPEEPPAEPEVQEPLEAAGEFVPTEEVYRETFQDIDDYISELNSIIRNKDYEQWVQFLTTKYKESLSDPAFLADISERPVLKNRNVQVDSLRDYFTHVVVPSRANIRLDDLVFLSDQEIEAIMVIGETRITVYRLVKTQEGWKIGAF